jgi:hypothetical protein
MVLTIMRMTKLVSIVGNELKLPGVLLVNMNFRSERKTVRDTVVQPSHYRWPVILVSLQIELAKETRWLIVATPMGIIPIQIPCLGNDAKNRLENVKLIAT